MSLVLLACLFMCALEIAAATSTIRTLAKGSFSGIEEAKEEIIKEQAAWEKFWIRHSVEPKAVKLPEVNFEKEMVIAVTMGRQRKGGFAIEVTDAREIDKRFRVAVRRRSPPPGSMAIQALTSPFHFVAVPRSDLKPQFVPEPAEKIKVTP